MGSRRNYKKRAFCVSKRAKGQRIRRQRERDKKIKDMDLQEVNSNNCMGVQKVTPLPVTEAAVNNNNVITNNNNAPLGQQNGILQVTPTFGFPTPTAEIQSNGILVLLNRSPQVVLPSPTFLAVPQQNNTIVEGLIPPEQKPTPIQNSSTASNADVAFAQGCPVISSDVTICKKMPVSSKSDLDIIKENLISKGTEIRIIESSAPAETVDSRAKKPLLSSKKVDSLSVKEEASSTESDDLVPVKRRKSQKCCIFGCGQQRTHNGPSIHGFPKNDDILTKWLETIGDRMLPLTLDSTPVICGQHFEQDCFVRSYNRKAFKTLKPGSVPTIFPPRSDSATASTTRNDDTPLVYDCQIKVEPVDITEPCASECLKAVKPAETSAIRVTEAETVDWDFNLKDMECPEKAKLYFLKVQKELALQKLQQEQPTVQCEPQTVQPKQEIVLDSDDEDGKPEKKRQKMNLQSTSLQQEKWKATGDRPTAEQDEFDAYSVTVAAKLRKMDSKQRMFAENMINQILYKGLMNQLSAVTQTTESPPTPPMQYQTMSACPTVQQTQVPLFALNINPPQIQGTFPFQNQTTFQNSLQDSSFSAILPSRALGQFSTTHFSDSPVISNFAPWRPGGSAI